MGASDSDEALAPCWEQLSDAYGNPSTGWGRHNVVQGWNPGPSGPAGCQEARVGGRRCSVGLVVATSNRQGPTVLALRAGDPRSPGTLKSISLKWLDGAGERLFACSVVND